jgi:hypothetical protein
MIECNRSSARTQISYYINPIDGFRGLLKENGKTITNHMEQNKQKLKEITNTNKMNKELNNLENNNIKIFKLKQFKNTKSKLDVRSTLKKSYTTSNLKSSKENIQHHNKINDYSNELSNKNYNINDNNKENNDDEKQNEIKSINIKSSNKN